ncbi:MAG: flagellar biosynthesis protein FlgD [Proteobacteria bacterium]|nr:MAG: flagellar biosynthesis protein FlgD [Pseudomonadota bacterium]
MSAINSAPGAAELLGSSFSHTQQNTAPSQELGRNEFMELMLAQMNNQNPMEPQDNGDFIAQLAQFSSLEEMQNMSSTIDSAVAQFRSTQALQASALVGRSVLVESPDGPLQPDGTMSGMVDLPASTSNLRVSVMNETGELVAQINMGQQLAGQIPFQWDGMNMNGQVMPPGRYTLKAEAGYSSGNEQVQTLLSANVDSVSVGAAGAITLNLAGVGPMSISDVRQIN